MKTNALIKLTAASLFAIATSANAATVTDTMTNKAVVADACDVVAIGIDFGTVPVPMLADFPGALPNSLDEGDTLTVLGITVPFTSAPGVIIVCTATPTSIALTTPNGPGATLSTAVAGSPVQVMSSKMMNGTNSLDYTMTLTGSAISAGSLPVGLPVGVFAAVYAGVGVIPMAQSGTFGPGTYTDTVTVTVNY